jgi:hypothetical protein
MLLAASGLAVLTIWNIHSPLLRVIIAVTAIIIGSEICLATLERLDP